MQLGANERDIMSELTGALDSMMQAGEESVPYQFWREASGDMQDMFLAVKQSDDIMVQNQLYGKAVVNMGYVDHLFSELDKLCFRDFERFSKCIKDLREYADLQRMLFGSLAARGRMFTDIALNAINYCYMEQDSEELRQIARNIIEKENLSVFSFEREDEEIECHFDDQAGMYYTMEEDMRVYLPIEYFPTEEAAVKYMNGLRWEQDDRSPHQYFNERMEVPEGAVVMDAGVAEGNFSVPIVKRAKKLYLVECDPLFAQALRWTFKDYMNKVVIVDKLLARHANKYSTCIDEIMQGEQLDYLKMDIEGAEVLALQGGERTLAASQNIKCNICVYHRLHDNEKITEILTRHGMEVRNTPGYMLFHLDKKYPYYPRKGLAQAVKISRAQ